MTSNVLVSHWSEVATLLDATACRIRSGIRLIRHNDPLSGAKVAMAGLFCKAHRDYQATLLLVKNDHADSARILARSVLESCLNILYINKEPDHRGVAFWQHEIQLRVDLAEKAQIMWPLSDENMEKLVEFESFVEKHGKVWGKRKVKTLGWPSASKMIEDLEPNLQPYYKLMYKDLSYETHSLPLVIRNRYVMTIDEDLVDAGKDAKSLDITPTLMAVCIVFYSVLQCISVLGTFDSARELESLREKMESPPA